MNAQSKTVVVGAGFSGLMTCANLIRLGYPGRLTLIERTSRPARGVAYDPPSELLLLNVPASRMGAWPDKPADFHTWLASHGKSVDPAAYVPRRWYGDYLADLHSTLTREAAGRFETTTGDAVNASHAGGRWSVKLDSGASYDGDHLVLALGNLRPGPPPNLNPRPDAPWWCPEPWDQHTHRPCRPGERVLVIGTGLTMADVCISLSASGARPRLTVLSRHGLLPLVHAGNMLKPGTATAPPPGSTVMQIFRHVRREANRLTREGCDWRAAIDVLRASTPAIWNALSTRDRERFLSHLRTRWDVHRHRVPADVLARLVELHQRGDLRILGGRISSATDRGNEVDIHWTRRGGERPGSGTFDRVINCTGARTSIDASPLLQSIKAAGLIESEDLGLGIRTDPVGRALSAGRPSPNVWAIGPLRRGTLWESTAVPELRGQALELAKAIAAA